MAKLESVSIGQILEIVWQLFGRRDLRALQKHWDDRDIAFESGRNFLPHIICRTVDAACA